MIIEVHNFYPGNYFTFHSGYILMIVKKKDSCSDTFFTFHSGYILIESKGGDK